MSSHHIVRDMQEPSLLIADGETCSKALLDSLLEWNPVVVALDESFLKLNQFEIKIDYWLGDFDSINPEEILKEIKQDSIEIIRKPDQNKTDFEKGIEFLIEKGAKAINLLWSMGQRLDHTLSNLSTIAKYKDKVNLAVIDDFGKSYFISSPFKKWYKKGQIISLLPFPIAQGVSLKGLKYSLDNETLEWGIRVGTSNLVAEDGMVTIEWEGGNLFLVEVTMD